MNTFTPHAPIAQEIADKMVFRRFKVKESSFFKSDLTDPPTQIFDRIFWKMLIWVLPALIFQWFLYQDHVLSQIIL